MSRSWPLSCRNKSDSRIQDHLSPFHSPKIIHVRSPGKILASISSIHTLSAFIRHRNTQCQNISCKHTPIITLLLPRVTTNHDGLQDHDELHFLPQQQQPQPLICILLLHHVRWNMVSYILTDTLVQNLLHTLVVIDSMPTNTQKESIHDGITPRRPEQTIHDSHDTLHFDSDLRFFFFLFTSTRITTHTHTSTSIFTSPAASTIQITNLAFAFVSHLPLSHSHETERIAKKA